MPAIRRVKDNFAYRKTSQEYLPLKSSTHIWRPFEEFVGESHTINSNYNSASETFHSQLEIMTSQFDRYSKELDEIKPIYFDNMHGYSDEVFRAFDDFTNYSNISSTSLQQLFKPIDKNYAASETSSLNSSRCSLDRNSPVDRKIQQETRLRRAKYTKDQLSTLNAMFERKMYLTNEERYNLSITLNIKETQIKNWFQNKRMKSKRDHITSVQTGKLVPMQNPDLPKFSRIPEKYFQSFRN